jgi:hypothetical protein
MFPIIEHVTIQKIGTMVMRKDKEYTPGDLETRKFEHRNERYYQGLETIKSLDYEFEDLVHHFPCFVGHMTLSRFLFLYECYKMTLGVSGHVAEVGTYKGASLLWLAKLAQIFEPESLTQVHGFDWFKGMDTEGGAENVKPWACSESYERLMQLIKAQDLQNVVRVHKLDVTKELSGFFDRYPHLQFKLVFLDAGTYEASKACIAEFWPRTTKGGILMLDEFNHELSPGETRAVNELLPDAEVRTFPWAWMPSGYIVK